MTGAELQAWRHRMRWSQSAAAHSLGISQSKFQKMEQGRAPIGRAFALACAKLWDDRASAIEWRNARAEQSYARAA
ncbi:MAG TPA: helix-turn-helix transcriptional regulator [Ramlibacter sp.]|nr:helix-turn-helix transcriptional regulator [Ramlibacter sp.]